MSSIHFSFGAAVTPFVFSRATLDLLTHDYSKHENLKLQVVDTNELGRAVGGGTSELNAEIN